MPMLYGAGFNYYEVQYCMPSWEQYLMSYSEGVLLDHDVARGWENRPEWPVCPNGFLQGGFGPMAPINWGFGHPGLGGTKALARLMGTVYDETETPVSGAAVTLFYTAGDVTADGVHDVTTDANGDYLFYLGDTTTEYYLRATKSGSPSKAGTTLGNVTGE